MDTVILLVYLAGCMWFLVPTAKFLLKSMVEFGTPDSFDYVIAALLSLCIVPFWPLYLPGWWLVSVLKTGA